MVGVCHVMAACLLGSRAAAFLPSLSSPNVGGGMAEWLDKGDRESDPARDSPGVGAGGSEDSSLDGHQTRSLELRHGKH